VRGGLRTPNTPEEVAFYLDQASRAEAAGARSAAIAMYRGALEQLFFERGYKRGTLNDKILKLEEVIRKGTADKWALDLDADELRVIKDLGNRAIHPNDGDVSRQSKLDAEALAATRSLFGSLLLNVYEIPRIRNERLRSLKATASSLKT
jgi:hypothetical protein